MVSNIPATKLPNQLIGKDKILHFITYFILAFLTFRAFNASRKFEEKKYLLTIIFVILYGALDEIHQAFVPKRSPEFADLLADSIGVLIFLFLNSIKNKYYKNTK